MPSTFACSILPRCVPDTYAGPGPHLARSARAVLPGDGSWRVHLESGVLAAHHLSDHRALDEPFQGSRAAFDLVLRAPRRGAGFHGPDQVAHLGAIRVAAPGRMPSSPCRRRRRGAYGPAHARVAARAAPPHDRPIASIAHVASASVHGGDECYVRGGSRPRVGDRRFRAPESAFPGRSGSRRTPQPRAASAPEQRRKAALAAHQPARTLQRGYFTWWAPTRQDPAHARVIATSFSATRCFASTSYRRSSFFDKAFAALEEHG